MTRPSLLINKTALLSTILFVVACPSSVAAEELFWQSPNSEQRQAALPNGDGQISALLGNDESQYERNFGTVNSRESHSSFAMTQSLNQDTSFGVSHASGVHQNNTVLGFTHKKLSVSYMNGSGENYAELAGHYNGIDPYVFRAGFNQKFSYSGYSADYSLGNLGHLQYGEATVRANDLLDRKAQYVQWAGERSYARVSELSRGNQSIGNGLDLGFMFSHNKQIGFQAMQLDNDRSLQRIRFQFHGKRSRQYWFDVTSHRNALYRDNDDLSIMFSFKAPIGARWISGLDDDAVTEVETQVPTDQEAAGAQVPVKKKKSMAKRMLWIGTGVAAAASLGSSGSESADTVSRFRTKQAAAFDVLNRINPVSVDENREYGGWVYQTSDGGFGSSIPVIGTQSMVQLPNARQSNPTGSVLAATYHTHAAFHRRFDNENFSPQDIESDNALGIDGYLATPAGLFKWHNVTTGQIITIGPIAN
jgi:hypothetical protein